MQINYKAYSDLEWREHHLAAEAKNVNYPWNSFLAENKDAKHATMFFDNGYGISVIKDAPLITGCNKFECAVIRKRWTDGGYDLDYKTGIADDVIRTNSEDEITGIMYRIQDLPPATQKDAA